MSRGDEGAASECEGGGGRWRPEEGWGGGGGAPDGLRLPALVDVGDDGDVESGLDGVENLRRGTVLRLGPPAGRFP